MTLIAGLEYCPLQPGTRKPLKSNWQTTTYPPEDLARYNQLGVKCGIPVQDTQGGFLVVFDIDVKNGKPGLQSWADFVAARDLPDTLTVRTGSGGTHFYFRMTSPPKSCFGFVPAVDVIGLGNLVVAQGVNEYGPYSVVSDVPIAWVPLWLESELEPDENDPGSDKVRRTVVDLARDTEVILTPDLLRAHIESFPKSVLAKQLAELLAGRHIAGPGRRHEMVRLRFIPSMLGVFGPGITFQSLCQLLECGEYPDGMSSEDIDRTRDAFDTARYKIDPVEAENWRGAAEFNKQVQVRLDKQASDLGEAMGSDEPCPANLLSPESDSDIAARFLWEGKFIYADETWHKWVGTHWKPTKIKPLAELDDLLFRLGLAPKHRKSNALFSLCKVAENLNKDTKMNQDPYLLSVANGTLDLRTQQLRPWLAKDMISVCLDTPYTPEFINAAWTRELTNWSQNDPEWEAWLQWYCSTILVGHSLGEFILFCSGVGRNGKSVLFSSLLALMGESGGILNASVLQPLSGQTGHTSAIGRNFGKRLLLCQELKHHIAMDMSVIKVMIGYTRMQAQTGMGKDFTEARPSWTLLCDINGLPKFLDAGVADTRRVRVLPWDFAVADTDTDRKWADKCIATPGYLQACLSWLVAGLVVEKEPYCARLKQTTQDTFDKGSEVSEWRDDCVELGPDEFTATADLWTSYQAYTQGDGLRKDGFKKSLERAGFKAHKKHGTRGYQGLKLKTKSATVDKGKNPFAGN